MNNIQFYYDEFEKQVYEIEQYITSIELQKSMIRELSEKENSLEGEFNNTLMYGKIIKDVITSPIQYNAVIISIYGSFEKYIDSIFNCYCYNLCDVIDEYKNLPKLLRDKQIKKLGDFLTNPQRYRNYNLDVPSAIENTYFSFSNPKEGIIKNISFLVNHGGNLKIDQIADLAKEFGIENFIHKITNNELFKSYFIEQREHSEETYKSTLAKDVKVFFDDLDRLVEARNDVAHGWVEVRTDLNTIKERWLAYLKILAVVINEAMQTSFAEFLYHSGKLQELGKPINVIDNHIVCINNGQVLLGAEDYVIAINGKGKLKIIKIQTIEIDGKRVDRLTKTNIDVGIGLTIRNDLKVNPSYTFYYFNMKEL